MAAGNILGELRDRAGKISSTLRDISELNRREENSFSNSEILEEIEEDEEIIEHFDRNVEKLEHEIDDAIANYNSQEIHEIKEKVVQLSENSLKLADRYSHLPERFTDAAIRHEDPETANIALQYYMKIEHTLELVEELCETGPDIGPDSSGENRKLKKEKQKLRNERRKLERKKKQARSKMANRGLLS